MGKPLYFSQPWCAHVGYPAFDLESGDSLYPTRSGSPVSSGLPEPCLTLSPPLPCACHSEDIIFGVPPRISLIKFEIKITSEQDTISHGLSSFLGATSVHRLLRPVQAHTLWIRYSCDQ